MFLKKKRVSFIQHKINLTEVRVRLVYPLCVLNTTAFIFLKKIHQIFICFPGNLKEGERPHSNGVQMTLVSGII